MLPPNKKKPVVALVLILIVGLAVWVIKGFNQDDGSLKLYGSIDMRTVDLAFEESGRVEEVLVKEGAAVKAGDVLARLDDTRYKIARDRAQAQVQVADSQLTLLLAGSRLEEIEAGKARLRAAKANRVLSEKICAREKQMGNASSQQARDQACYAAAANRAAEDEAQKALDLLLSGTRIEEIDVARATLNEAKVALADAERALNNCVLRAPSDAVVRSRLKEAGDMVGASAPIFELALMQPLWARVYIDESNLGQIAMGQSVEVTVDSFPNEHFSATVGFISSVAEFTPKTVQTEALRTHLVYEVRLTVDDPEHRLRLGMPVTARLIDTK